MKFFTALVALYSLACATAVNVFSVNLAATDALELAINAEDPGLFVEAVHPDFVFTDDCTTASISATCVPGPLNSSEYVLWQMAQCSLATNLATLTWSTDSNPFIAGAQEAFVSMTVSYINVLTQVANSFPIWAFMETAKDGNKHKVRSWRTNQDHLFTEDIFCLGTLGCLGFIQPCPAPTTCPPQPLPSPTQLLCPTQKPCPTCPGFDCEQCTFYTQNCAMVCS